VNKQKAGIHVFIISWTGKHQSSLHIANEIKSLVERTTVIYSDKDPSLVIPENDFETIKVDNSWYWGKKFQACLQRCGADILLIIHADTECQNWQYLIERCRDGFEKHKNMGVYSPEIDYTFWSLDKTATEDIPGESLTKVVQTDGIVFALSKPVWQRLADLEYETNNLGWGIDWAAMAYCYANNLFAAVDRDVKVQHPKSTGYDSREAKALENRFLGQLSINEKTILKNLVDYAHRAKAALNTMDVKSMTISLDLGSGPNPQNPFKASQVYGLDLVAFNDNVKACDLGFEPLPYKDSTFDFCSAFDLIEHIPRNGGIYPNKNPFIFLMNEIWRILKPKGRFYGQTPAFPFPTAFSDPTHVNVITSDTVLYFGTHVMGDGTRLSDNRKELGQRYGFTGNFDILRNYSNQAYGHQIWLLEAVK
jgi:SAM-dependent methyltransferase